jgi:superfamily II DNA helicase RecQ
MYSELANLRGSLVTQIVACTATADQRTLSEARRCLRMAENTAVIAMTMSRPNLSLVVLGKHPRTSESELVNCIRRSSAERVLIFCQKRDETQRLVDLLTQNDVSSSVYHSGVTDRPEALHTFVSGTHTHEHMHAFLRAAASYFAVLTMDDPTL